MLGGQCRWGNYAVRIVVTARHTLGQGPCRRVSRVLTVAGKQLFGVVRLKPVGLWGAVSTNGLLAGLADFVMVEGCLCPLRGGWMVDSSSF